MSRRIDIDSSRRRVALAAIAAPLLAGLPRVAAAQAWPARPLRLIVPFAAGGTTDALGRVVAQILGDRLGQQVVVDNRPGGGGVLGAEVGARAQPDGYTLLMASAETFGMTNAIAKRLTYDPDRDLVPCTLLARAPNVIAVHPSVKATSMKELTELARQNPGKIRYGSPGIGSNPHLIGALFADRMKVDMTHVPYKGGGNSIIDLVSGQIEALVTGIATVASRHKAGQARGLAVTGTQRTPLMPDVPTMAEAGIDDFVLGALFGVFLPAGAPAEAVTRVSRELVTVSESPEFRRRLVDIGQEPTEPLTGAAHAQAMRREAERWRRIAELAGVRD